MKLYRVLTENKNYENIVEQLDRYFPDGYTIINANGAWQGQREKSLIIEIVANKSHADGGSTESSIGKLAYWLKKFNGQQAVMVQTIEIESQLI